MAHCAVAKSDPVFYAGYTLAPSELVSEIAKISPVTMSKLQLIPFNMNTIFRRNFNIDDLKAGIKPFDEHRIHEGVPPLISQLQNLQLRLLLLQREMALLAPALACVTLGLYRKQVLELADMEASDIMQVDCIRAIWLLPFKRAASVNKFVKACGTPQTTQYALDL